MFPLEEIKGGVVKRIVVLFLLAALYSCSSGPEPSMMNKEEGERGTEAVYFPSEDARYKTCGNAKFNFWFDLPNEWRAFDKSAVGDGYFLECDNEDTDIRIFAMQRAQSDEEWYRMMLGDHGEMLPFTFADGKQGTMLSNDTVRYFVRNTDVLRILLYVKTDTAWYEHNAEAVLHTAKSIRMGK